MKLKARADFREFMVRPSFCILLFCITRGLLATRLLSPWNFPGKNTGIGCHFLLLGIFLTQEFNPGLLHFLH